KFSTPDGAPALPEVTREIEAEIEAGTEVSTKQPPASGTLSNNNREAIDVRPQYLARLKEVVDVAAIKKSRMRVVFDPMWGAGRGYSDAVLRSAGIAVDVVHDTRDVLFGGHAPEPDDHLLEAARTKMRETSAHIV